MPKAELLLTGVSHASGRPSAWGQICTLRVWGVKKTGYVITQSERRLKLPHFLANKPTVEGTQPGYSGLWGVGQMILSICALQVPPGGSLAEVLSELLKGNGKAGNAELQSTQASSASPFPKGALNSQLE